MKKPLRTYVVSKNVAFVPHPNARGLWMCVHSAVVLVPCPYLTCEARCGEPCRNRNGDHTTSTHYVRRNDAKGATLKLDPIALKIEFGAALAKLERNWQRSEHPQDCRSAALPVESKAGSQRRTSGQK